MNTDTVVLPERKKWQICSECFVTFEVKESQAIKIAHRYFCCEKHKVSFQEFKADLDSEVPQN